MKLVMTLLVRDEADIISSNIDFHLDGGVDFFIVTDNLSVDGTADILRRYERRGILHYIYQEEDDYSQSRWVTHMARMACTDFGAHWVINSDADEFWWPACGNLKQAICATSRTDDALSIERVNFPPRSVEKEGFFVDAMTVRARLSLNALGQPLPGKVCHRAFANIEVEQGNHAVFRDGSRLASTQAPITIFHFPMRSYQQFANKIAKGGAAYERNTTLPFEVGGTWRYLYKLWQRGELKDYYQASVVDDEAVKRGLREENLVLDERLKNVFSRLNG